MVDFTKSSLTIYGGYMLFVLWTLIALVSLSGRLSSLDLKQSIFQVMLFINSTSKESLVLGLIGLVGFAIIATRFSHTGHGILTTLSTLFALFGAVVAAFSFWGFAISGGFLSTFSPQVGMVRLEFLIFLLSPIIETVLMILIVHHHLTSESPLS